MMDEMKKKAKKESLMSLRKAMMDEIGSPFGESMQKVSVMSDDQEGLKKGLEKAEEILESGKMSEEPTSPEDMEMPEIEMEDDEMYLPEMDEEPESPESLEIPEIDEEISEEELQEALELIRARRK
jgi:hypothetical protein